MVQSPFITISRILLVPLLMIFYVLFYNGTFTWVNMTVLSDECRPKSRSLSLRVKTGRGERSGSRTYREIPLM